MITGAGVVEDGCLSYLRAYHIGVHSCTTPDELLQRVSERHPHWRPLEMTCHGFYELSTLRRRQVARAVYRGGFRVEGRIEVLGSLRTVELAISLHLLVHMSGLIVLRPTVRFDQIRLDGGQTEVDLPSVLAVERAMWRPDADLRWYLDGEQIAHGWGRGALNYVFLQLMDAWARPRRRRSRESLYSAARETMTGADALVEMHRRGVLDYPFPVTFGAEVQLMLPREGEECDEAWRKRVQILAREALPPLTHGVAVLPRDVEDPATEVGWFFDENRAVVIRERCPVHEDLDVFDADRTQLLEFVTLRRAALSCVRRATQISLIECEPITRSQIESWQHLVTATTDDYVLDARIGSLLQAVRCTFAQDPRLRSLDGLEQQVRRNLDALQARIDSATERSGGLAAALFGGGALVLGLQTSLQMFVALLLGVGSSEVPTRYAGALAVAQLVLVTLSFAIVYLVIRRPARVLRSRRGRGRRR